MPGHFLCIAWDQLSLCIRISRFLHHYARQTGRTDPNINNSYCHPLERTPMRRPSKLSSIARIRQLKALTRLFLFVCLPSLVRGQSIFEPPSSLAPFPTPPPTQLQLANSSLTPTISRKPSMLSTTSVTFPTLSPVPSARPTNSSSPSLTSTSSKPTTATAPYALPTAIPLLVPSASPSQNETLFIQRRCTQILEISTNEEFDDVEVGIYQLQMQSYTENFGFFVSPPFIITTCEVIDQVLAGGGRRLKSSSRFGYLSKLWSRRRLQTAVNTLLVMEFTILYETNYGYDISNYPTLFQSFINSNLETVTQDMQTRFLPVVQAKEVIVYNTDAPTVSPIPTHSPSYVAPTTNGPSNPGKGTSSSPTPSPSSTPSVSTLPTVSMAPVIPIITTPKPTRAEIIDDNQSFVVGLAAGLSAAALLVMVFILYTRRMTRTRRRPQNGGVEMSQNGNEVKGYWGNNSDGDDNGMNAMIDGLEDGITHITGEVTEPIDAIMSNPSMVSEGESLDSNPNDIQEGVPLETLQDEFDSYKNQDLEFMRSGVEESVYGAEGMMSLAMTRALMEEEDNDVDWGGAQDCISMEANIFCETNDWLRKNEGASLDARIKFFQGVLNRMVITVRRGMVRPADGTRAVHCCAAMLGMPLEKDIPNNVVLVYGMRKTNDLSRGRSHLVEAFKPFGDIESAGISPSNKGFGFVRFVHPKSVDRAFDRFRVSEIEVQDVSVMIKPLKPEYPAEL